MPYQSLIDDMSLAGCPVVLVCREFEGDENLGVRYLANALSQAGIDFKLFALNQVADIDRIASQVLELHALLVGISLSDNNVALDLLSFVEYLRFRGYRGQIVAGGALATVQRHHILAHHSGIDSIVRLQGEHALVKLARCIIDNSPIEMVPGLTTRAGDGTPVVDSAALFTCRPLRDTQLPTALGVSTARLIASRGCSGHCVYCGSTALRHIASSEARRAGWSTERIVKAGIGARRTRPLSDFADEVAELYHARGVRFFHLHDDNILGPHEMPALDWLHTVQQYLDERQVGRVAWSLMLEPSVVTEQVADALTDFGLIRTLIGVESLTPEGLAALGRNTNVLAGVEAVSRLHRRGIAVFFNSILLHPKSTAASLAYELSALPLIPEVPFDVLPLLVYPGTELYDQLQHRGLLLGGMLGCDYRVVNEPASRFRAIWHRFLAQMPDWAPLGTDAHENASLLNLARRLELPTYSKTLSRANSHVTADINALRIAGMKNLLAIAESEPDVARGERALTLLVQSLRPRVQELGSRLAEIRRSCRGQQAKSTGKQHFFVRTTYAASLLVLSPSCGGATDDSSMLVTSGSGGQSTIGAGGHTSGGANSAGGLSNNAGSGNAGGASAGLDGGTVCTANEFNETLQLMDATASAACGPNSFAPQFVVHVNDQGQITALDLAPNCNANTTNIALRDCAFAALSKETFPCMTDGYVWGSCYVTLIN